MDYFSSLCELPVYIQWTHFGEKCLCLSIKIFIKLQNHRILIWRSHQKFRLQQRSDHDSALIIILLSPISEYITFQHFNAIWKFCSLCLRTVTLCVKKNLGLGTIYAATKLQRRKISFKDSWVIIYTMLKKKSSFSHNPTVYEMFTSPAKTRTSLQNQLPLWTAISECTEVPYFCYVRFTAFYECTVHVLENLLGKPTKQLPSQPTYTTRATEYHLFYDIFLKKEKKNGGWFLCRDTTYFSNCPLVNFYINNIMFYTVNQVDRSLCFVHVHRFLSTLCSLRLLTDTWCMQSCAS